MIPSTPTDHFEALTRGGYARIRRGNLLLSERWGHDYESTCHLNTENGTAVLRYPTRRDLPLPVQILGTYTRSDSTFTWVWETDQDGPSTIIARHLRRYGERFRLTPLQETSYHCRQDHAWNLTAVATLLAQAWTGFELQDSPNEYRYLLLGRPLAPDTPKRIRSSFEMPITLAA